MEHLKMIDFLAPQFSFTLFKSVNFKTYLGSCFSLILLILILIFSFIFGSDLFYRTNPTVNRETKIGKDYHFENLTLNKFFVPWQITYLDNRPVNYTGILFPNVRYIRGKLVNKIFRKILDVQLNYSNCDKKYNSLIKDAENYNCIDFNPEYEIGGYYDNDDFGFFSIEFYYCPSRERASLDGNCTTIENLRNFLGSQISFSMYYPMIHYESSNEDPLSVQMLNYYYLLSPNLVRIDRAFFIKSLVDDDVGLMLKEKKSSFKYYLNNIKSDLFFQDPNYYYSNTTGSGVYNIFFYLGKNYDIYNRSYMKIQNLTALVGSFISVIRLIGGFIYYHINIVLRDIEIVNKIFQLQNSDKDCSKKIINISEFKKTKFSDDKLQNDFYSDFNKRKDSEKLEIKTILPGTSNNYVGKFVEVNRKKPELFAQFKKYLLYIFCTGRNQIRLEIYLKAKEFLNNRLDFMNYLKLWEQIQKIQFIVLNNNQNCAIKFSRKLCFDEPLDLFFIDENKSSHDEVIQYFKKQFRKRKMTEIDQKVFELLDDNLIKLIKVK